MKNFKLVALVLLGLLAMFIVPSILAGAPTGAGPNDPLMVTGTPQTIAPKSSLWFYFDYTGDKSKIQAALDANGASGMQMAIFTPPQAQAWLSDQTTAPIALGSQPGAATNMAIHDLYWQGGFNFPGRFFVVITNSNSNAVTFRLSVTGDNVALAPTPTATPPMANPFATPIPTAQITGTLVFQDASGGVIYTVQGDGTNLKRVTTGLDPAFSPDGKQIAFTRWAQPAGVYTINADGTNEQTLLNIEQPLSPQWSPDGKRIVFTRPAGGPQGGAPFCFRGFCFSPMPDPHWKLGVIDLGTNALTQPECSNHCFAPTWFNDNHTIAYADGQFGVQVADTNGGPAWPLYTQNVSVQSTQVSPDGTKIVFMVRQNDHWEINVMNADGSNVAQVTRADPLSFVSVNNVAPTWSPDSKQILFLSDRGGKWEFFTVNPEGSNLRQVLKSVTDKTPIRYNFSNERVIDWIK